MEYITVKEVMQTLGISRATAYKLIDIDGFPALKIGRVYRIDKKRFENWVTNKLGTKLS